MKKQNIAGKYFTQKSFGVIDIVSAAVLVVFIVLLLVNQGRGRFFYLGLALIPGVVLVFSRTSKVSDSEFDGICRKLARDNGIPLSGEYVVHEYDLDASPVRLGSDQRARSSLYVVGRFEFSPKKCVLTRWEIDVMNENVREESFTLGEGDTVRLDEKERVIDGKKRTSAHIGISGAHELSVPVNSRSTDGDNVVERFGRL